MWNYPKCQFSINPYTLFYLRQFDFLPEREYAKSGNEESDHMNEQNSSGQFGKLQIVQQLGHLVLHKHTHTHFKFPYHRCLRILHCHDVDTQGTKIKAFLNHQILLSLFICFLEYVIIMYLRKHMNKLHMCA